MRVDELVGSWRLGERDRVGDEPFHVDLADPGKGNVALGVQRACCPEPIIPTQLETIRGRRK